MSRVHDALRRAETAGAFSGAAVRAAAGLDRRRRGGAHRDDRVCDQGCDEAARLQIVCERVSVQHSSRQRVEDCTVECGDAHQQLRRESFGRVKLQESRCRGHEHQGDPGPPTCARDRQCSAQRRNDRK
mgnify:CR=1 FL=1